MGHGGRSVRPCRGRPTLSAASELPPGQRESTTFPRFGLAPFAYRFPTETAQARVRIVGDIRHPVTVVDELARVTVREQRSDLHCVTTWSRLDNHWSGVRFSTIAELAVPKENATWILCTGYDRDAQSGESYTTNLPLSRAIEDDVLLVHTWEGKPLPREHGGPCRMITPRHSADAK